MVEEGDEGAKAKKPGIVIPSHSEVAELSKPKDPPSLFKPSSDSNTNSNSSSNSFRQAFSFVKKNAEFYTPPPTSAPTPNPRPETVITGAAGVSGQARNAILVSHRQQGNPVLKHIKNVRWMYADIVPDYQLGQNSCALFLSLRYHLLHPDYLYFRIRELQKTFRLRVVLCHADLEDVIKPLHEVTKTALLHECTLLCAWSPEECARYLETIKIYENKPADDIQERTDNDYLSRLTGALTTVRHINKTDVVTLGSNFGTLAAIMGGSMEELARCPGIGEKKVKRLYDAFHEPFRKTTKQLRLSSVGITSSSTPKESKAHLSEPPEFPPDDEHEVGEEDPGISVRKALDAVYAKHGTRLENPKCVDNELTPELSKLTPESSCVVARTSDNGDKSLQPE